MANPHCVRLSEGFTLRDVTGDGACFSVMSSNMNEAELEPANDAFEGEARLAHYRADVIETDSDKYSSPFERLKSIMENVTDDGSVMKKTVRTGADVSVPRNAFVTFHYNAYMEYTDEPFDSSVLQGKPCRVKLNSGGLLPGLELGLLTMRKSEKADILVQPHMAYGPQGCPPRIPPNSEVLFDVELLDWTVTPDSELIEAIDEAHLSNTDWDKARSQAMKLHIEGNDWFKRQKFQKALRAYKSAEKIVGTSRLKDEKEENDHNLLLRRLHTNMAICFYKLKKYNDVCIHCKEAINLHPQCAKSHYYWGMALTALNEFPSAKYHLKKAKDSAPKDKAINDALNRLEERVQSSLKQEQIMWTRAINPSGKSKKTEQNPDVEASSPWKDELAAFKDSTTEKRILLPGNLDEGELDAVIADVKALNLQINISDDNVCVFKEE